MFTDLIAAVKKHPVDEKILLQPSNNAGSLIIDRLCRELGGVANFRSVTVKGLALQLSEKGLAETEKSVLPDGGGDLIVQNILPAKGYYNSNAEMPGLPGALWRSISELRLADVQAGEIKKLNLEPAEKATAIAALLDKTVEELDKNKLADWAEILQTAIRNVALLKKHVVLLIPGDLSLAGLEKKFIDSLACKKIILGFHADNDLLIPQTWTDKKVKPLHPASLLNADPKVIKAKTSAFISPYFDAEVLEIIRRIKTGGRRLEEIEIALANPHAHSAMTFSLLDTAEIPWKSSFPRPVTDFRVGRAAVSLSRWVAEGFKAPGLISMLESNEIRLFPVQKGKKKKNEIPGTLKTVTLLRDSHAVGGRSGFEKPLEELKKIKADHERVVDEEQLVELQKRLKKILAVVPEKGTPGKFAMAFMDLFKTLVFPSGDQEKIMVDQMLIKRICALCESMADLKKPVMGVEAAMTWFNGLISNLSCSEQKTGVGRILITAPGAHGLSGRPLLFFAGLNHSAVPGHTSVDPVINDQMREALIKDGITIRPAEDKRLESLARFNVAIASLPADTELCLSASEYELDRRAASLSSEFARIVKRMSDKPDVSLEDLKRGPILPLCGYDCSEINKAVSLHDFLKIQAGNDSRLKYEIIKSCLPSVARYQKSFLERADESAAVITGLPEWDSEKYDFRVNGRPVSTSYISSLSGCNIYHFLKEVLHCMPYDQITWQQSVSQYWLDHLQRGALLHEIFELFLKRSGWPVTDEHQSLMYQVIDEVVEKYRTIYPPPDKARFAREKKNITEDTEYFFELQKKAADNGFKPVGFEIAFGMNGANELGESAREPVEVTFVDGSRLLLRGKIDRIDQGPDGLRILDYKTGRSRSYKDDETKREAADLQMAVYTLAAEELVRRNILTGKVASAALYFPTRNGEGLFLEFDAKDAHRVIRPEEHLAMFDIFSSGRFSPLVSEDCQYCNVVEICPFCNRLLKEPEQPLENKEATGEEE